VAKPQLVSAGLLSAQALLSAVFAFGLIRGIWTYKRERQIKDTLKAQREVAEEGAYVRSAR
jgi:hypothetical protein